MQKKKKIKNKHFFREIDEMIKTVDKNEDGKISYSEFRVIQAFSFYLTCSENQTNSGIESDIKPNRLSSTIVGNREMNGPIIHNKCRNYSLPTFIYAKYIYIYLI